MNTDIRLPDAIVLLAVAVFVVLYFRRKRIERIERNKQ